MADHLDNIEKRSLEIAWVVEKLGSFAGEDSVTGPILFSLEETSRFSKENLATQAKTLHDCLSNANTKEQRKQVSQYWVP
jgi:hypothetical protein